MSVVKERRRLKPERHLHSVGVESAPKYQAPNRQLRTAPVSVDEEMNSVIWAAFWMLIIGISPLVLFYIITSLYPDFFLVYAN